MVKRVLTETLELKVTWRLALSALVGATILGASTIAKVYSYGDDVLKQAQTNTELILRNYVPYSVWLDKWEVRQKEDAKRHEEIIGRLIRLEGEIKGKRHGRN